MAVVWAKQNGNWTDSTIWATYNEEIQQIEDYNNYPQFDEEVYFNGHTVTMNTDTIHCKSISNYTCPYTNRSAGWLTRTTAASGGLFIYAHVYTLQNTIINLVNIASLSITGNVYCPTQITQSQVIYQATGSSSFTLNITGNVYQNGLGFLYYGNTSTCKMQTLNVVGSVFCLNTGAPCLIYETLYNCHFGNLETYLSSPIGTTGQSVISIYGTLTTHNVNFKCQTLTVGAIRYENSNFKCGIDVTTLNYYNPNTFQWKDITEPRTNPFFIVTNADLNNEIQYPNEDRVVEGTPYAFNQMVGRFAVDYPQEAVVLKDVIYDSGNKTGKLVVLPAELISRLLNCPTIETMQQLLIAHLNPETD